MCSTFAGPCRPTAWRLHFFSTVAAAAVAAAVWQDIGMPTAVARESANLDASGQRGGSVAGAELIDTLVASDVSCVLT